MEDKTVLPTIHPESQGNRAEWITPAIVDYDIEEVTRASFAGAGTDGIFPNQAYS